MSVKKSLLLLALVLFVWVVYSYFTWGLQVPFKVKILERNDSNHDGAIDTWRLDAVSWKGHVNVIEIDSDHDGRVDRLQIGNSEIRILNASPQPEGSSRRKLIVCLDGVPYEDIASLWDQGHFREFARPGKLISSFPSLSDVALTEALHTAPVPGYENLYFDVQRNQIAGGATSTLSKVRMPYLEVLDYDEPGVFKGLAYIIPIKTYRADLGRFLKKYCRSTLTEFKAHICSTDSICHVMSREEFRRYLLEVDSLLREIYVEQQGQLDFIVFSDHGNSHVQNRRMDLENFLSRHGFNLEPSIRNERSVVYPGFGLVGALPLYCQPQSAEKLANALSGLEGVDFSVYLDHGGVRIASSNGTASIRAIDSGKRLKYILDEGDPLLLKSVIDRMSKQNQFDSEGFASCESWFEATAEHEYADAVNTIYRGVTNHVTNRASLLVSLKDGYHYGSAFFDKLVTMRSTHGNLRSSSMTGFFMRNGPATRKVMSSRELLM